METSGITELISAALPAVGAMVLIYILTVKLPDIAAFVDKHLKREDKMPDDGLYDIYGVKHAEKDDPDSDRDEIRRK